jgi:excisionase family DNA binding protein
MEKLLTVDQATQILGIKAVTLRSWIAKRMVGSTRLGKRAVRIPESEIQKLIERGLRPALPERSR